MPRNRNDMPKPAKPTPISIRNQNINYSNLIRVPILNQLSIHTL